MPDQAVPPASCPRADLAAPVAAHAAVRPAPASVEAADLAACCEALRRSEERFRALVEASSQVVWTAAPNGDILAVSPSLTQLTGLHAEDVLGTNWVRALHPDDRDTAAAAWARAVGSARPYSMDYRLAMRGGSYRWYAEHGVPILDDDGRVAQWIATCTDVHDRHRAEDALRASTVRLQAQEAALSALTRAVIECDELETALPRITRAAAETLGVARVSVWIHPHAAEGLTCLDLYDARTGSHTASASLPAAAFPGYFRALRELDVITADDATTDARTRELNESYLAPLGIGAMMDAPVRLHGTTAGVVCHEHVGGPRPWTADERTFAVAIANLVSLVLEHAERRQSERALRLAEQRFRQLADSIDEVFWLYEPQEQRLLYVSPAFEAIWEHPCDDMDAASSAWWRAIHPEDRDRMARHGAALLTTLEPQECEYRIVRPNGALRWIRHRTFPVLGADARVARIAGVAEDVTERKSLEARVTQSQKMEAVGQLAGGVAHDFNNLLTIVQMQSSFVLGTPDLHEDIRLAVDDIAQAAERGARLTRQLLAFSRRDVKQARDLDLGELLTDFVRLCRRVLGEDVVLTSRVAPDLPRVHADPGMMEQVVLNLAVNARDAMPAGGTLHLELDAVTLTAADTATRPDATPGPYLRLEIRDTGCGIAPEHLPHIFEPFFTTKAVGRGTGLGLAIVFGVVRRHGGWIETETRVGGGTTFRILLPALAAPTAPVTSATAPVPGGGQEVVLLVEDEPAVRALAARALTQQGYRVLQAENGVAAMRVWAERKHDIHVIVSDVVMPGGMSGTELAGRARAERPGCPVLLTSGYDPDTARLRSDALAYPFLQKPYTVRDLADAVRRCLDGVASRVTPGDRASWP